MQFETHITVAADTPRKDWSRYCASHSMKPIMIRLMRGQHLDQMMSVARFEAGDQYKAEEFAYRELEEVQASFDAVRLKMEGPLHRCGESAKFRYLESHIKALVPPEKVTPIVESVPTHYGVSESIWGAFNGYRKLFVTHRIYPGWWPAVSLSRYPRMAQEEFAQTFELFDSIATGCENEVVYLDSDESLDKDWMTEEPV